MPELVYFLLLQMRLDIDLDIQKLSFCGKALKDKKTLGHYNIHHESNIHFSIQTFSRSKMLGRDNPGSCLSSFDTGDEMFHSPKVNWDDMADKAKSEVDKLIERKKIKYDVILDVKMKTVEQVTALKEEIERDVLDETIVQKALVEKDEEIASLVRKIAALQEEIRSSHQAMFNIDREKMSLCVQIEAIQKRIYGRQSRLNLLLRDIANLDENMRRIVDEDETRAKEKPKMREDAEGSFTMKDFLNESITAKKALLECPVCYETASPPIHGCPREHLICSQCLPRMNHKCPSCRVSIPKNSYSIFRIAEEIWVELQNLIKRGESL